MLSKQHEDRIPGCGLEKLSIPRRLLKSLAAERWAHIVRILVIDRDRGHRSKGGACELTTTYAEASERFYVCARRLRSEGAPCGCGRESN